MASGGGAIVDPRVGVPVGPIARHAPGHSIELLLFSGPGLSQEDLPRAFERFYLYSRYSSDRPVGTGLGLSIVKELTQGMGGSVEVDSAPGHGTRFTVRLPGAGGDDFTDGSRAPNRDLTQESDNASPSELHVTHAQSEADES